MTVLRADPPIDAPRPHLGRGGATSDLVLVSSGPGELSNWAMPMAREAAAWATERAMPLALSLILPPCQFASGAEVAFARRQGLFARVLGPRDCLSLVAGLSRFPLSGPGGLLHLGGDFWYSATLGRRLGVPAFAYAETLLVRRRAHRFRRVFLPAQDLAGRLAAEGVDPERLAVVGDLRVDHLSAFRSLGAEGRTGGRVALLPGSRRWIIEGMLPLLLPAAAAIRAARPEVRFDLIVSPFLPERDLGRALAPHRGEVAALGIGVVRDDRYAALGRSDLAVTLPGTNTVELAALGVPMLVVLPLDRPGRIRTEGMSEWLGRIPGVGSVVKAAIARRFAGRGELVAWPNREVGRPVVPELIGHVTPEEIARRVLGLLGDRAALERISAELRGLYATPPGVARRIMDEMTAAGAWRDVLARPADFAAGQHDIKAVGPAQPA